MDKLRFNIIPKLLLHFFIYTVILNISCSEESLSKGEDIDSQVPVKEDTVEIVLEKNEIENATLAEKLTYKDHHLTSLIEEVLEVNPDFEDIDAFEKSKNENPAVYIEDLLGNGSQNASNNPLSSKSVEHPSLEAFSNLENETWYPVLELLKKGNGGAKKAIYLLKSFDENSKKEFVKGYQLKQNGKFELVYEDFTEEIFRDLSKSSKIGPSVYLTSLYGCYSTDDPVRKITNKRGCGSSSGGGSGGGSNTIFLDIERMRVKDKKESWIESGDVYFKGSGVWIDADGTYTFKSLKRSGYDYDNHEITTIPNKDVGNWKSVNYNITTNTTGAAFFYYVIYENDGWPAPKKYVSFSSGSLYKRLRFRSYNREYSSKMYTSKSKSVPGHSDIHNAFGNTVNNKVIDYEFSPAY